MRFDLMQLLHEGLPKSHWSLVKRRCQDVLRVHYGGGRTLILRLRHVLQALERPGTPTMVGAGRGLGRGLVLALRIW